MKSVAIGINDVEREGWLQFRANLGLLLGRQGLLAAVWHLTYSIVFAIFSLSGVVSLTM